MVEYDKGVYYGNGKDNYLIIAGIDGRTPNKEVRLSMSETVREDLMQVLTRIYL